jgi:hypothetical protein
MSVSGYPIIKEKNGTTCTFQWTIEVPLSKDNLTIFPNPCRAGQKVSFCAIPDTERALEILIFDMQGRLIAHETAASTPNFRTPERSGTYTVLFREKEQLLGVSKLIVMD